MFSTLLINCKLSIFFEHVAWVAHFKLKFSIQHQFFEYFRKDDRSSGYKQSCKFEKNSLSWAELSLTDEKFSWAELSWAGPDQNFPELSWAELNLIWKIVSWAELSPSAQLAQLSSPYWADISEVFLTRMTNLTRVQLEFQVVHQNGVTKGLKEMIWWCFWKFGSVKD